MRQLLPIAFTALASFAVGFAGMRRVERATPPIEEARVILPAPAQATALAESADGLAASSKERINAFAALCEKPAGLARDHDLFAALQKFDARDFAAAGADGLMALLAPPGKRVRDDATALCEAWMDRWLEVDAPGALHFLESWPMLHQPPNMSGSLANSAFGFAGVTFKALARREPAWTFQHLAAQTAGPGRNVGIYVLLDQVAREDSAKARQYLASFSDGPNRRAALQGYVGGMAEMNVRAGFDVAMAEAAGPFREDLLMTAMRSASKRGVATVRDLLDRIDDPALRQKMATTALDGVTYRSREDPLPWIIEESQRSAVAGGHEAEYDWWRRAIAQAVQGPQVASAAEWAATLASDPGRKTLEKIGYEWAWRNPVTMRAWLAENASTLDAAAVEKLHAGIARMTRGEAGAMQAWSDALPPGRLRDQVKFQIALSVGAKSGLGQVEAAYDSMAANDATGALAKQLAIVLADQDGPVAADWAMRRPAGPARDAAIKAVAGEWSQRDPRGAAEWLGQMPAGADRDAAVSEYAWKVVYADPAAAAEWVGQVADPAMRTQAAEKVFWLWKNENPIAARVWLRGMTGVDETWKTKFLKRQR